MKSIAKTLFISVILLLLFVSSGLTSVSRILGQTQLSLKIIVAHDAEYNLTVSEVNLVSLPSSDYKIELPNNYYTIKIISSSGNELFSGKVSHTTIIYPPPPREGEDPGLPIVRRLDKIVVYLPFFEEAEKVVFLDEQGNLKLEIDLNNYNLRPPDTFISGYPTPTLVYTIPISGEPTCDECGKCAGSTEPPNYSACKACIANEGNSWTPIGCLPNTAAGFVNGVLRFLLPIAGGFSFLGILWGGFLMITSKGDVERIKRGRSMIIGSIGALLLIIFAVFLLRLIGFKVLGIPGFQ